MFDHKSTKAIKRANQSRQKHETRHATRNNLFSRPQICAQCASLNLTSTTGLFIGTLLFLSCVVLPVYAKTKESMLLKSSGRSNNDIFASGIWYRDSYVLQTSSYSDKSPDCHYSLKASIPFGTEESGCCRETSPTSLDCDIEGMGIVYNATSHTATYHSALAGSLDYYDGGYQPTASPFSGTWTATPQIPCPDGFTKAVFPYAKNDTTIFYPVELSGEGVFECCQEFDLRRDYQNDLVLTLRQWVVTSDFKLYDVRGMQINATTDLRMLKTMKYHDNMGVEGCVVTKSQTSLRM